MLELEEHNLDDGSSKVSAALLTQTSDNIGHSHHNNASAVSSSSSSSSFGHSQPSKGKKGGRRCNNHHRNHRHGNNNGGRESTAAPVRSGNNSSPQQQTTTWAYPPWSAWSSQPWATPPCPYPTYGTSPQWQYRPRSLPPEPGLLGPRPAAQSYNMATPVPTDINQAMHTMSLYPPDSNFYMDTGATSHMTHDQVMPDFAQVYSFIGSVFDPSACDHLQRLKTMDPINVETVLLLMRNLSVNLLSPEFKEYRKLFSSYDAESGKIRSCSPLMRAPDNSNTAIPTVY